MTDWEKLVAKTQNAFCVEEVTTKKTYYDCFGDKIDEQVKTTSTLYQFDKDTSEWVKGAKI